MTYPITSMAKPKRLALTDDRITSVKVWRDIIGTPDSSHDMKSLGDVRGFSRLTRDPRLIGQA